MSDFAVMRDEVLRRALDAMGENPLNPHAAYAVKALMPAPEIEVSPEEYEAIVQHWTQNQNRYSAGHVPTTFAGMKIVVKTDAASN